MIVGGFFAMALFRPLGASHWWKIGASVSDLKMLLDAKLNFNKILSIPSMIFPQSIAPICLSYDSFSIETSYN
jgi:hypothetical protein